MKTIIALFLLLASPLLLAMVEMRDEQLSEVSGQALLQMDKEFVNGFTFYTAGLDAILELNLNIEKLQLGCGGINGAVGCDIDADNFALGCIADSSGNCTHGPGSQTQMKDLVMTRPYFQFAIKNDNTKTLREVTGIRLGGQDVNGPMSIGSFNSFSGYLSANANFTMEAQGTDSSDDIAVTCGTNVGAAGCPGPGGSPGFNDFGLQGPIRSLGLDNGCACLLGVCARYEQLTVRFGSVSRLDRPVLLSGNRQTQAFVSNAQLSTAVEEIADTLVAVRSSGLSAGLINLILPLIQGQVENNIKAQLAAGFGIPVNQLENHQIPYNITNLHSVDVDTPLFGLSFQKENVQYPGYVSAVSRGWAMYLPDAFTLDVSEPTTVFVNNIVSGAAAAGNIVPLPVPGSGAIYDNCWGSATFC